MSEAEETVTFPSSIVEGLYKGVLGLRGRTLRMWLMCYNKPKANPKASPKAKPKVNCIIEDGLRVEGKNLRTKGSTKRNKTKGQPKFKLEDLDILNRYYVECVPCERIRLSLLGGTLERHLRDAHGFTFVEAVDYCTNELRPKLEARLEAAYFKPLEHKGGLIKDLSNIKDDLNPSVGGLNERQLIRARKRHGRKLWHERWKIVSSDLSEKQLKALTKMSVKKFGGATIMQGLDHFQPKEYVWEKVLSDNPNYLKIGQDDEFRDEEK